MTTKNGQRWDYETHQYKRYLMPENAILFSDDMEKECACAQCGKTITFGEGYTSMEVQTDYGFGYCICKECHEQELERRFADVRKECEDE